MRHLDIAYYLELQRRLKDILLYISCHEDNFETYSIKIENLFVDICAFLDSLCQSFIITKNNEGFIFSNSNNIQRFSRKLSGRDFFNMNDYKELLLKDFDLSNKAVNLNVYSDNLFINTDYINPDNNGYKLKPFGNWLNGNLNWWQSYTKLKHNRLINIKEASLENTINSLGATFIIVSIYNEQYFKGGKIIKEIYEVFFPLYWTLKGRIMTGNPIWN